MNGQIKRTDKGLKIDIDSINQETYMRVFEYLANDLLFWNDMYFETYGTEWLYIEDANNNAVYMVNGYGYDHIDELIEEGTTSLQKSPMTYEEY